MKNEIKLQKICKDCETLKSLSEFYKKKNGWSELYCKKCYLDRYSPNRGKPNTGRFKKGHIPWNKKSEDGRLNLMGQHWQKYIWKRDNYTCQECHSTKILHTHHIKSWEEYPELRYALDNGITLCSSCHARLHGKRVCNLLKNGKSWITGKKMSLEYRKKLSKAHKGKKLTEEHRKKLCEAQRKRREKPGAPLPKKKEEL